MVLQSDVMRVETIQGESARRRSWPVLIPVKQATGICTVTTPANDPCMIFVL